MASLGRRRWERGVGVAVHSACCTCSQISSCSGTWGSSILHLISCLMSPGRVASSSGVGEILWSPSMGLRMEASTITSLLRTNKGAMHQCSSHAASQSTPGENPDSSAQACSTLAKAMVFCCLIIWNVEEVRKACSLQGEAQGL